MAANDSYPTSDRPAVSAEEIEITPEVIEVGVLHLYRYHPDRGVIDEETVRMIFQEMKRLRPLAS